MVVRVRLRPCTTRPDEEVLGRRHRRVAALVEGGVVAAALGRIAIRAAVAAVDLGGAETRRDDRRKPDDPLGEHDGRGLDSR